MIMRLPAVIHAGEITLLKNERMGCTAAVRDIADVQQAG
jgi:hypothetical protein